MSLILEALDSDPQYADALRRSPCLRIRSFLPPATASVLYAELRDGIRYERVVLGDMTRQWRAVRPVGDVYLGSMARRQGWETSVEARDALALFESDQFLRWLSRLADRPLAPARPPTAYRMDRGDRICLHDDMSDPDHAVSVAYNLSPDWRHEWGGATVYGTVTSVVSVDTPPDSPIDLFEWQITDEQRFVPLYNSLLVMRLGHDVAHGVEEITGGQPRLSVIGIYSRAR